MKLNALDIMAVWPALGGGPLRGKRGKAFWRDGDGYSIALETTKGTWYDHRDGRGGGTLSLVETALGCDRRSALRWLEADCGLDRSRPLSAEKRRTRCHDHHDAEHFVIVVRMLAEQVLDQLEVDDPDRAIYTGPVAIVRRGGVMPVEEYQGWLRTHPELTRAMVQAGAASQARIQRRLALYLMEKLAS